MIDQPTTTIVADSGAECTVTFPPTHAAFFGAMAGRSPADEAASSTPLSAIVGALSTGSHCGTAPLGPGSHFALPVGVRENRPTDAPLHGMLTGVGPRTQAISSIEPYNTRNGGLDY